MEQVRTFVRETITAFNDKDTDGMLDQIILEEDNPRLTQLHQALYNMSEESVRTVVLKTMGDDNRPLRDLITNYLIFTIASALETSSMVDVYDLISACY
ncbi:hypothetical protein BX616_010368, partial [Lobosporangium transversale]